MSAVLTHPEMTPQRPHCLAEDAVQCEPVSDANSLLTGKLTGNFAVSGPLRRFWCSRRRANSMACSRVPYAMEQGIFVPKQAMFCSEQGIFVKTSGNDAVLPPRSWRPRCP